MAKESSPDSADSYSENSGNLFAASTLGLLCLVSFGTTLRFGFTQDDLIHIRDNALVHSGTLYECATAPLFPGNLYRPLVLLSHCTLEMAGAGVPLFHHLTNVLLHFGSAFALFFWLSTLLPRRTSLYAAAFFAANPYHAEAVSSVSGRAELLAAFFVLIALGACAKNSRPRALVFAALSAFLACCSKESAVVAALFPFILPNKESISTRFKSSVALGLGCCAYLVLRLAVLGADSFSAAATDYLDNPLVGAPPFERAATALLLLGRSLGMTYFPWGIGLDYSHAFYAQRPLWEHLFAAGALAFHLALLMKSGIPRFCVLFFLSAYLVSSNIFFAVGTIFAERLAYLPSVGTATLAAWALGTSGRSRNLAMASLAVALAIATNFASRPWERNATLFLHQVTLSPESAKAQQNYGLILRNSGDEVGAEIHLRRALVMYPAFSEATFGLGTIAVDRGKFVEAEQLFRKALGETPTFTLARTTLVRLLLSQQRFEEIHPLLDAASIEENASTEFHTLRLALAIGERDGAAAGRYRRLLSNVDNPEVQALVRQFNQTTHW